MRTARNIAIIALLALGVAFLPRGGDFADAVLTAITMGFLAAFAYAIYGFSRENQLTLLSINEPRKGVLYGSFASRPAVLHAAGCVRPFVNACTYTRRRKLQCGPHGGEISRTVAQHL